MLENVFKYNPPVLASNDSLQAVIAEAHEECMDLASGQEIAESVLNNLDWESNEVNADLDGDDELIVFQPALASDTRDESGTTIS